MNSIRYKSKLKKMIALPRHLLASENEEVVIFLHLPKCGGTTLSNVIKANYNPWRIFDFTVSGRRTPGGGVLSFDSEDSPDIKAIKEYLNSKQKRIGCVLGHIPYGIHRFIERRCLYISFVREPISRVWSQFNHIVNRSGHYLHPFLKKYNFDLGRVLDSEEVFEFCNDQSRMLLGTSKTNLEKSDVEAVIDRVENDFFYVNVLERFDQGITSLHSKLGWNRIGYKRFNVGTYQKVEKEPSKSLARQIKERNIVDQALYEYLLNRELKQDRRMTNINRYKATLSAKNCGTNL